MSGRFLDQPRRHRVIHHANKRFGVQLGDFLPEREWYLFADDGGNL